MSLLRIFPQLSQDLSQESTRSEQIYRVDETEMRRWNKSELKGGIHMFRVCVVQIGFVFNEVQEARICSSRVMPLKCKSSSAVAGQWVITEGGREDINRACNSVRTGASHSRGG